MGDQYQGGALFLVQGKQQVCYMLTIGIIQTAGGLIGKQQGRGHREGPRQRNALLFPAR